MTTHVFYVAASVLDSEFLVADKIKERAVLVSVKAIGKIIKFLLIPDTFEMQHDSHQ